MGSLAVFICLFAVSACLSCEPCEKDICEIGPHNVKPTCYKVSKTVHITDPRLCVKGESEKQKFALVLKLRFWYTEGDFD